MKKLFTVTEDMNTMSHDQLKGAVRNMEQIANAMAVTLDAVLNEHESNDYFNVLTMSTEHWSDGVKEMFLPSTCGRTVIIPTNRPDSLMRWKLQFFAKYGNLNMDIQFKSDTAIELTISEKDNEEQDGYESYAKDRSERSRSDAALYESMRNVKRY